SPDVELILPEGGALLSEIAERLVERRLVRPSVDLEEQLARLHERAVRVVLLEQIPLHPRHDLRVHEADRRPDPLAVDRHVLLTDLRHDNRRRWWCRRRAVIAADTDERARDADHLY